MKEKLEQQIQEIANFPENLKKEHGLDTIWLTQQNKTIKHLTDSLRAEVNKMDFELFRKVMGDKVYNTEICYNGQDIFQSDKSWNQLGKPYPSEEPIQELKDFFASPNELQANKRKIEEIIIFAIFLQATWDFYRQLELRAKTGLVSDEWRRNPLVVPEMGRTDAACRAFYYYFTLLDNFSYKCNPTAYKLLTALNYTALYLVVSALFIGPFSCLLIGLPPLSIALLLTMMVALCFVIPMSLTMSQLLPVWTKDGLKENAIDEHWGKNWAYLLPNLRAGISREERCCCNPADVGIFPFIQSFSLDATYQFAPVGASFKAMNHLGFFSFKETANEAIEIAERVLENTIGKTYLANHNQP
jgi:hypothetical protein